MIHEGVDGYHHYVQALEHIVGHVEFAVAQYVDLDAPQDLDVRDSVSDLVDLLPCFGLPAVPDCESQDVNEDGTVNVLDLIDLLLGFRQTCG